ncbi:hypothetical protein [Crocosphaera sp. XPORK-15E]|uniref:hypothetical protein n=1 Tax=Crocosphaera sp. XPORK-15E TaxID=3110247 RepID=UPI002B1F0CAF|nr:hypothetical protein [Crocosphaera sp. XPORK-15E]MEA5533511.1 hypothetical protein [Crocosphaera sp. XPORK-15E]
MKFTNLINPGYIYQRRDRIVPKLKELQEESIESICNKLAFSGYPITSNDRHLVSLKNIHHRFVLYGVDHDYKFVSNQQSEDRERVTFATKYIYS